MEWKMFFSHFVNQWEIYFFCLLFILVLITPHFEKRREPHYYPIKVSEDPSFVYCESTTTWCLKIANYSGYYPSPAINCTTRNTTIGMNLDMIDDFFTFNNITESQPFHESLYKDYKEACYLLNKTTWKNQTETWIHYEGKQRQYFLFNATWQLQNKSWVTVGTYE